MPAPSVRRAARARRGRAGLRVAARVAFRPARQELRQGDPGGGRARRSAEGGGRPGRERDLDRGPGGRHCRADADPGRRSLSRCQRRRLQPFRVCPGDRWRPGRGSADHHGGGGAASAGVSVNPNVTHHPIRVHPAEAQPAAGIQRRATAPQGNSVVGGTWTSLGPAPIADEKSCCNPSSDYGRASGRMTSVAVDPTNAAVIFAGTAGGGVWKSSNAGATWTALTDSQVTLAIGSLAIDPSGQVLYAGTGEANGSIDSQAGQGILKTTDAGASWSLLGQTIFAGQHIGGLAIDPPTTGASHRVIAAH